MSNDYLQLAVSELKGVGPKLAQKLAELKIHCLQDVLFHLPLRYEDRSTVRPIAQLIATQHVLIQAEVTSASVVMGKRRSLLVTVKDATGMAKLRFYHFNHAQKTAFKTGLFIQCFGEVRIGSTGLEFYHPEYQLSDVEFRPPARCTLTAVYPTVKQITQKTWRSLVSQSFAKVEQQRPIDYLAKVSQQHDDLLDALHYIHQPPSDVKTADILSGEHRYQQRLILEELAAQYVGQQLARALQQQQPAIALPPAKQLQQQLLQQLPFKLTGAQQRVCQEIAADMAQAKAMMRLVQGDVGSGKTLVAAIATLAACQHGYQCVMMAPTELLAEQHSANFSQWLTPLGIEVSSLLGSTTAKQRRERLAQLASGEIQVLVGTHAVFQADVHFKQVALVIVDEQHRFGVHQRLSLKQKNQTATPHQLVMTATPIPRTLAMSHYAQLDCSVIDELPPGRKPITTTLLENQQRPKLIERVQAMLAQGQQAYWVCTLVEESDELQAEAAEATAETLTQQLPDYRVGLIHGRLKSAAKAEIMAAFKAAEIDLLVATTVIEVGVDVPNANIIVIENPERLGLAQLHQLRGRVGRGQAQSYCLLLYQKPLSNNGKKRLQAMRDSSDGFYIAEQDLAIRGPGEILGTRQTGELGFRIADLQRDSHLLGQAKQLGQQLLQVLTTEECEAFVNRWLAGKLAYSEV